MEMLWIFVRVVCEMGFYAWFFYKSCWAILVLLPIGFYRFWVYGNQLEKKKEREFEIQFRECIMAVATSLKAGYSLENAFAESVNDMKVMFGEKSSIVRELGWLCRGIKNNRSIETVLEGLSKRSGSGVVKDFTDIINIAVLNGGNLIEIISSTANLMNRERQTLEEIADIISGKKMEGKIMSLIPFLMIIYVQLGSPGYFDSFYHNLPGVLIMSVCLILYLLAIGTMEKILEVEG